MRGTRSLLVALLILQSLLFCQDNPDTPAQTKPLPLSRYMRHVGLDYVETAEKGVDFVSDLDIRPEKRSSYSDAEFKLLDASEARIEIDLETQADKDFFKYGLKILRSLASTYAARAGYALVLADVAERTSDPIDQQKAEETSLAAKNAITPYVRCKIGLRKDIKDGWYALGGLADDCRFPPDWLPSWVAAPEQFAAAVEERELKLKERIATYCYTHPNGGYGRPGDASFVACSPSKVATMGEVAKNEAKEEKDSAAADAPTRVTKRDIKRIAAYCKKHPDCETQALSWKSPIACEGAGFLWVEGACHAKLK